MLKLCLAAIEKNSQYRHQVIVHVNEGSDGTHEWILNSGLDYTFSDRNAGVCYAVNAMAQLARCPYIVYLNDDMYVCPQWDTYLYNEVKNMKSDAWFLSGTMIEPETSRNDCAIAPHNFGRSAADFNEQELLAFAKRQNKPDWFGACWPPTLVSKKLFDEVGGFSEAFSPGMYSDPDFAMKLWQHGVRCYKGVGKSLVYHFLSKSTQRVEKNDGRKQFAEKWGVPSSYFYKHVLRMGEAHDPEKELRMRFDLRYLFAKLRAAYIKLK